MAITDSLLPEFDHEMGMTRRLFERVPESEFAWRPHERSMTLGQLCGHLANLPAWCSSIVELPVFDLATLTEDRRLWSPASSRALLQAFDTKVAAARASVAPRTDQELLAAWTLKQGTHEIFTLPRISALRSLVMNHSIHHRGQLSVYLRLRDVPLPALYGPSADTA